MTANRAEQKGGGSMEGNTTAEQRAALEKDGYNFERATSISEQWLSPMLRLEICDDGWFTLSSLYVDDNLISSDDFATVSAILGIGAPPGYVMVPVEVAERAAREVSALATAHEVSGFKKDAAELRVLASALARQ